MGERLVLSMKVAAVALGISDHTLRQAIREGRVPAIRVSERRIVVPRAALLKLLEGEGSGKVEGASEEP